MASLKKSDFKVHSDTLTGANPAEEPRKIIRKSQGITVSLLERQENANYWEFIDFIAELMVRQDLRKEVQ